ncbi:MAG: hypothetical protein HEEMFOPI_01504 [Holosporales bacterium]
MVIWASTYYFLQKGVSKNWINDFFGTCGDKSLSCFEWKYVNLSGINAYNNIISYFVQPNIAIAWSFYVISRLMEASQRYLLAPLEVRKSYAPTSVKFKIANIVSEVLVLGAGVGLAAKSTVSFYNDYVTGNWLPSEILPYAIPLGIFLSFEGILTFKTLKEALFFNHFFKQGKASLKEQIIQKLEAAQKKLTLKHNEDIELFYRNYQKQPTSFDTLKFLLSLGENFVKKQKRDIVWHAKRIGAGFAFLATVYVLYLNAHDSLANVYDSIANGFQFIGGISPFNQKTYQYFLDNTPDPYTSDNTTILAWWTPCLDYARKNMVDNSNCTEYFNSNQTFTEFFYWPNCTGYVASFGHNCKGIMFEQAGGELSLPGDASYTIQNAKAWLEAFYVLYQGMAGNSTDPFPPSEKADTFGKALAPFYAIFTASLMSFQTFRTIGDFHKIVHNPSRLWLNIPILTFCVFEAIFRTLPESMVNFFAIQNNAPNALLYPLAVCSSLVIMCTYINYFFDHYKKLPGVVQQMWRFLCYGKASLQGNTFVEPAIPYAHQDALENHINSLKDFVVKASDETVTELANVLEIRDESEEKESIFFKAKKTMESILLI